MTTFPNDRLDQGHSHGDLLVQVCATDEFATVHALRYLMTGTRETLRLRWMVNGFHRAKRHADARRTRRPAT